MLDNNLSNEKLTIGLYARGKLLADETISDLVGTRIYPNIAPEGSPSPFVVYERDSYLTEKNKMGVHLEMAEIVYEVVSDDYDTGLDILLAIRKVLQGSHGGFTFNLVNSVDYYKEQKYRQLILFTIK